MMLAENFPAGPLRSATARRPADQCEKGTKNSPVGKQSTTVLPLSNRFGIAHPSNARGCPERLEINTGINRAQGKGKAVLTVSENVRILVADHVESAIE
jgi:hypothetical protein